MNLYVGNLSPETTEKDLLKAFQAHGAVSSVSLLENRMRLGRGTGLSRGFGFVMMPEKTEGLAALAALNLRELHGRAMTVLTARPTNLRRRRS